ncbi:MAG: hypothetical protein ACOYMR_04655 [Ilumatobacteraceae bacterium]
MPHRSTERHAMRTIGRCRTVGQVASVPGGIARVMAVVETPGGRTNWDLGTRQQVFDLAEHAAALCADTLWRQLRDGLFRRGEVTLEESGRRALSRSVDRAVVALHEVGGVGGGLVAGGGSSPTRGLALAWSGLRNEMLIWSESLAVVGRTNGRLLVVETAEGIEADGVREMRVAHDHVRLETEQGEIFALQGASARHLASLVPHATSWRARVVPRVVVWANALSGLESAANWSGRALRLQVVAGAAEG